MVLLYVRMFFWSSSTNYRPISNLSLFNKMFEQLIYNRIKLFLDSFNISFPLQYGFRKFSNTTLEIFHLVTNLLKSFNSKKYTIALFIDLKKAFDTVD